MPEPLVFISVETLSRIAFGVTVTTFLCSCAAGPETIPEKHVDTSYYKDWSCRDLEEESADLKDLLSGAYAAQNNARRNDEVALALLGVPLSSLEGNDRTTEIGLLKGMMHALEDQRSSKNCSRSVSE